MTSLHPLVAEVAGKQIRILRIVYSCFLGLIVLTWVGACLVGEAYFTLADTWWVHVILVVVCVVLMGIVLPLARRRLMQPARVMHAAREDLRKAGLPEDMDIFIGRQAVFLSRYTAGCIITWGLCASVALYGMIVNLLGAPLVETGLFFMLATLTMLLLRAKSERLNEDLLQLQPAGVHSGSSCSSAGLMT